jgi:hypothetical protein
MLLRPRHALDIHDIGIHHISIHDISDMPSFIRAIRDRQQEDLEREARPVDSQELYDELLDKFCFGSKDAGEMRRVLSKL